MGRYSKTFSIKKQFQSPNCQTCQGQSRTMKKIIFLELFLRIIEDEKWNLFEKLGQLRTPNAHIVTAPDLNLSPFAHDTSSVEGTKGGKIMEDLNHP